MLNRRRLLIGSGSLVGALVAGGSSMLQADPARAATRLPTNASVLNVSDKLTVGSGDLLDLGGGTDLPKRLDVRLGTNASPDRGVNIPVKVSRTIGHTAADLGGGDASNVLNAISGIAKGTAGCGVQPVGVYGLGWNVGTTAPANGKAPDAVGGYFVGQITANGIGVGIGACIVGANKSRAGSARGMELAVFQDSGAPDSVNPSAISRSQAIWMHAGDCRQVGAGIEFGNPFGAQFDVGIHFDLDVRSDRFGVSHVGPTKSADYRSDSAALKSILIKGTHAEAAIAVAAGAGKILVGKEDGAVSGSVLEVGNALTVTQDKRIGLFGAEPVAQPRGYSPPYDMATLGPKLIEDLKGLGLIAA